jgi:DNA-binding MarR family transcriptional regulator
MPRESKQELIQAVVYEARASQAADGAFDVAANAKLGINDTDGRALSIIDNEGGSLTAGHLAELMGLTTAAVTAVLDRLERAGYARRVRDDADRRRVIVELTPEIRKRGEKIWGPFGEEINRELARLSADELRAVIQFFRRAKHVSERHVERIRQIRFD